MQGGAAGSATAGRGGSAGADAGKSGSATGGAGSAGTGSGGAGSPATGGDRSAGGRDSGDDETGSEEHGFTIRKPGPKNLDFLCTFHGGAEAGFVYVRLLQTGTRSVGLSETPIYEAQLAQLSIAGAVADLDGPRYDYGGGHHNDALTFDHAGQTHSYYHSSFGFGFRSCQGMDCRNVYALGTTTLETQGCSAARSLPEVCVTIGSDGTHAALDDTFEKCAGDPN